jgi:protein SCO1/2
MQVRIALLIALLTSLVLCPSSASGAGKYLRKEVAYKVPQVTLINQMAEEVYLPDLLEGDRAVMVDFVYATCTTICPVLSAGFANFQKRMADEADEYVLVSFSIDPEHDTPEIMTEYLERYRAREGWYFLTGSRTDIDAVMRAFDAYVSNKMSHKPLTFLKAAGMAAWIRLDGLMGTSDLMGEYRRLAGE